MKTALVWISWEKENSRDWKYISLVPSEIKSYRVLNHFSGEQKKIAESKIITLLAYGHRFDLVNPGISLLFERRNAVTFQTS